MLQVLYGISALVLVFLLVIILGLQMQISTITRRIDEILNKLPDDAS